MKYLSSNDLPNLIGYNEPCLSVYIALDGTPGPDEEKIENTLTSAILQARSSFPESAGHFKDVDVGQLMGKLCIQDSSTAQKIQPWRGLAYFKSTSVEGFYPSIEVSEDLLVFAKSFHLKPLFGIIQIEPRYLMINLDDRRVELYQGSNNGIQLIKNFERRVSPDWRRGHHERDTELPETRTGLIDRNRLEKRNIFKFYREVETAIRRVVNLDTTPVILIGPDRVIKLFITANRYRTSFIRTIATERTEIFNDMDYLHQLGLESLVLYNRNRGLKGAFEFKYLRRFGCAVDTITHVAKAASDGLVQSLLIRRGINLWGQIDSRAATVNLNKNGLNHAADDILDDIGEMVLSRGGEVHVLHAREMPTQSPIAAVLAASLAS